MNGGTVMELFLDLFFSFTWKHRLPRKKIIKKNDSLTERNLDM